MINLNTQGYQKWPEIKNGPATWERKQLRAKSYSTLPLESLLIWPDTKHHPFSFPWAGLSSLINFVIKGMIFLWINLFTSTHGMTCAP